jgi:hypothetical protein
VVDSLRDGHPHHGNPEHWHAKRSLIASQSLSTCVRDPQIYLIAKSCFGKQIKRPEVTSSFASKLLSDRQPM